MALSSVVRCSPYIKKTSKSCKPPKNENSWHNKRYKKDIEKGKWKMKNEKYKKTKQQQ